ncbi:hypothetical protein PFICI_10925 [Pestalotiopsis fici W106-1]|uniref:Uncharacterized protein n=1 Tax=Pestalotiopsis fici (strain W106-1 / CGMCC3.15140) TaxID=1229662 RepID=W3WW19_PESFW|nr:uncharacterized protein PFICI_10925 [Pestalotiopsis fici W106-1]ETS77051.1 hypothetical protein PFICI_10925 [Pestalotiopsis fici W106-1]
MPNRQHRKQRFQTSSLDPSWILPDEESAAVGVAFANASETASISDRSVMQPEPRAQEQADDSDTKITKPVPSAEVPPEAAASTNVYSVSDSSNSATHSSVRLTPPSREGQDKQRSENEDRLAVPRSQVRRRRRKRYTSKHAPDWLENDAADTTSREAEGAGTAILHSRVEGLGLQDRPRGVPVWAPPESRPIRSEPVADVPSPFPVSIFRISGTSHYSSGYDAPPIAPQTPSTYSPSYRFQ